MIQPFYILREKKDHIHREKHQGGTYKYFKPPVFN